MMNVFAQSPRLRQRACQLLVSSALILPGTAFILPGTAWAACTADSTGQIITCDGSSASYTNLGTSLQVTADATSVVVAPLVIGSGTAAAPTTLTVASGGTIQGSNAVPSVQFGDYAQITNNGTITSSSATAGASAIQVGINSTVTNNGTLTAASGTPAVTFTGATNTSTNGTFINGAAAPAAVVGNIVFGYNSGTNVGTFTNAFNTTTTATSTATYGLTGNVTGTGNLAIDNEGAWTGSLGQTALPGGLGTVTFTNGVSSNFSGIIQTGGATTIVNNATGNNAAGVAYGMALQNGSAIGVSALAPSSFTNNGTLAIGATTAPAQVTINGSFTQTANGILNMAIAASGPITSGASSEPYSQIDVVGGTANLAGTLNVNVVAGFFPVGSKYDLIVADNGISGNFSKVNVLNSSGATLPFISFVPSGTAAQNGVISAGNTGLPTQEFYEFTVARVGTYASGIASVATPNELEVAQGPAGNTGLQALIPIATATPTGQEAVLIGQIDQLTVAQATALFDELSPAGYISYGTALRDEANNFERQIQLRMLDQNSDHAEDGWWGTVNTQIDVSSAKLDDAKQSMFGFNLGYDLSGPHHVFGVAGNVSFDSLHNLGSTLTGHNRDFALAAYGGQEIGPIHLTGQLAYNFGHLSTNRTLTLGTATDTATAAAGEHLFKATGTAGFMLKAGGYTFEPFGGIDFMRGKISGFTEQGDGAAALTVLPINIDRTDVLAGLAFTRSSGKLRPYVRATYRSEIGNEGDSTVNAYFDGNNATQFTVTGLPAARHEVDLNAGINLVFEDAGSLFVGYQGTMRNGFSSHGINLGLRLEF